VKVYIASGLENAPAVKALMADVLAAGHTITYNWTEHGSVQDQGPTRMTAVAMSEIDGVRAADVVVVLLPGGKGTHVEMGIALALEKRIIVVGDRRNPTDGRECAFYHALDVVRIGEDHVRAVAPLLGAEDWSAAIEAYAWDVLDNVRVIAALDGCTLEQVDVRMKAALASVSGDHHFAEPWVYTVQGPNNERVAGGRTLVVNGWRWTVGEYRYNKATRRFDCSVRSPRGLDAQLAFTAGGPLDAEARIDRELCNRGLSL